jgi:hypothetical protein
MEGGDPPPSMVTGLLMSHIYKVWHYYKRYKSSTLKEVRLYFIA